MPSVGWAEVISHGKNAISGSCINALSQGYPGYSSIVAASVLPSPAEEIHDSPCGTTTASMVVATVS